MRRAVSRPTSQTVASYCRPRERPLVAMNAAALIRAGGRRPRVACGISVATTSRGSAKLVRAPALFAVFSSPKSVDISWENPTHPT